jgi:hypothetical protein
MGRYEVQLREVWVLDEPMESYRRVDDSPWITAVSRYTRKSAVHWYNSWIESHGATHDVRIIHNGGCVALREVQNVR